MALEFKRNKLNVKDGSGDFVEIPVLGEQKTEKATVGELAIEVSRATAAEEAIAARVDKLQKVVGSPFVAATAASMTNTDRVYVYTGSETGYTAGNWYYYDGTAWVSGGVYNSAGVNVDDTLTYEGMAADAKATGDEFTNVKNAVSELDVTKAPVIINSASGDIVTFADGADDMPIKSLVATIEPAQSGSGDPSPNNIRPITGWTGLTGKRTGGNLFPMTKVTGAGSGTVLTKDAQTGTTVITNTSSQRYIGVNIWYGGILSQMPFPKGIYTMSFDISGTIATNWLAGTRAVSNSIFDPTERAAISSPGHYAFTFDSSAWSYDKFIGISRVGNDTSDINITISNLTVVPGAAEGTFEPYVSKDISVNWQDQAGTVYGGTVDVLRGILVDDTKIIQGNEIYVSHYGQPGPGIKQAVINTPHKSATDTYAISSTYRKVEGSPTVSGTFAVTSNGITICDSRFDSAETAQSILQSEGTQFVYKIDIPLPYLLTPQEVTTLLGNNVIYVDCGSITVDYPADTRLVVSQQKNAIDQKADKTTYVTLSGTTVTQTGADNTMYLCGELATLSFTAPQTGITAIRFTSGTTPTVATFSGVTWLNGFDPTAIEASKTYEVNILNGLGCASWT